MHTAKMADSELKATKQCHVTCRSQFKPSAQARNNTENINLHYIKEKVIVFEGQKRNVRNVMSARLNKEVW